VHLGVFCEKQADGRTPLFMASVNGHVEAVVALVGAGAAVNEALVSVDGGAIGLFACVGCQFVVVLVG
jgi:ankyrin repeat protein